MDWIAHSDGKSPISLSVLSSSNAFQANKVLYNQLRRRHGPAKLIQNTGREGSGCSDIPDEILSKVLSSFLSLQTFGLRNCSHRDEIRLKLKVKRDRIKCATTSEESSLYEQYLSS